MNTKTDSKLIEEVVKEYRNLFSTGHSEMPKDELVFVPDKESKRGEDWLRITLTTTIARVREEEYKRLEAVLERMSWDIKACSQSLPKRTRSARRRWRQRRNHGLLSLKNK